MKLRKSYVEALVKEINLRAEEFRNEKVDTIYFGGGTPGILPIDEIEVIIAGLKSNFNLETLRETTLETNPDDVSREKLLAWKELGINRLSVGLQSFNDQYLNWMNRAHDADQSLQSIKISQEAGFDNISIDLIYGLPELDLNEWEAELQKALDLNIQHISAYCLTVEPKTALAQAIKTGRENPVNEEAAARQFEAMQTVLSKAGFSQYEVSNFALSGFESQHNSSYWSGKKYLGFGPAAHSFDGSQRAWNVSNNALYIQKIKQGELPLEIEVLSKIDRFNEWVMTGLRTRDGISLSQGMEAFKIDLFRQYESLIEELVREEKLVVENDRLKLTQKGLFFADGIASDFFILEHED